MKIAHLRINTDFAVSLLLSSGILSSGILAAVLAFQAGISQPVAMAYCIGIAFSMIPAGICFALAALDTFNH